MSDVSQVSGLAPVVGQHAQGQVIGAKGTGTFVGGKPDVAPRPQRIQTQAYTEVQTQDTALKNTLAPYLKPDGKYDLLNAVAEKKIPRTTLVSAFGDNAVRSAETRLSGLVKVKDGYIDIFQYNKLNPTDQKSLKDLGFAGFEAKQQADVAAYKKAQTDLTKAGVGTTAGFDIGKAIATGTTTQLKQVTNVTDAQIAQYQADNVKLSTGEWIARKSGSDTKGNKWTGFEDFTPEQQAQMMKLGTVGFNAQVAASNAQIEATNAQIEAQNAKIQAAEAAMKDYYVPERTENIADPKFIGPVDAAHPAPTISISVPAGYNREAAVIAGKVTIPQLVEARYITNTPEAIAEFKAQVTQQETNIKAATVVLSALNNPKYKVTDKKTGDVSYKTDLALKDKVITVAQLRDAGFDMGGVDSASAEISKFLASKPNKVASFFSLSADLGTKGLSLRNAIQNADFRGLTVKEMEALGQLFSATGTKAQLRSVWKNFTPEQKAVVANLYAQDKYKKNYLGQVLNLVGDEAARSGILGELVFSPITGISRPVAKQITGQRVSTGEWVGAGVTAVANLLMVGQLSGAVSGARATIAAERAGQAVAGRSIIASRTAGAISTGARVAGVGVIGYGGVQYGMNVRQMTLAEKAVYGSILAIGAGFLTYESLSPATRAKIGTALRDVNTKLEARLDVSARAAKGIETRLEASPYVSSRPPRVPRGPSVEPGEVVRSFEETMRLAEGQKVIPGRYYVLNAAGELVEPFGPLGRRSSIGIFTEPEGLGAAKPISAAEANRLTKFATNYKGEKFYIGDEVFDSGVGGGKGTIVDITPDSYGNPSATIRNAKGRTWTNSNGLAQGDVVLVKSATPAVAEKQIPARAAARMARRHQAAIDLEAKLSKQFDDMFKSGEIARDPKVGSAAYEEWRRVGSIDEWLAEQSDPYKYFTRAEWLKNNANSPVVVQGYHAWARSRWMEPRLTTLGKKLAYRAQTQTEMQIAEIIRKGEMKNPPVKSAWAVPTETQIGGRRPLSFQARIALAIGDIENTVARSPGWAVERFGIKAVKAVVPDIEELVANEKFIQILANKGAANNRAYLAAHPELPAARALKLYNEARVQLAKLHLGRPINIPTPDGGTVTVKPYQLVKVLSRVSDEAITIPKGGGYQFALTSEELGQILEGKFGKWTPKATNPLWVSDKLMGMVWLYQSGGYEARGEMPKAVSAVGYVQGNGTVKVTSADSQDRGHTGIFMAENPVENIKELIDDGVITIASISGEGGIERAEVTAARTEGKVSAKEMADLETYTATPEFQKGETKIAAKGTSTQEYVPSKLVKGKMIPVSSKTIGRVTPGQAYLPFTSWDVDPKIRGKKNGLIPLAGDTNEVSAVLLTNQIVRYIEEKGWNAAFNEFGMLPVLAIYPKAIIYAVAERGEATPKQLNEIVTRTIEYYQDPSYGGSKQVADQILKYLEDTKAVIKSEGPALRDFLAGGGTQPTGGGTGQSSTEIGKSGPMGRAESQRVQEENRRSAQTYAAKTGIVDPWLQPQASLGQVATATLQPGMATTATLEAPASLREVTEAPTKLSPEIQLGRQSIEITAPKVLIENIIELDLSVSARQRAERITQVIVNNLAKQAQQLAQQNMTINQLSQALQTEAETQVQQQVQQQVKQAVQQAVSVSIQQIIQQVIQQTIRQSKPGKGIIRPFLPSSSDIQDIKEGKKSVPKGTLTWQQGKLKQGAVLKPRWWVWPPPYDEAALFSMSFAPKGAKQVKNAPSALTSLQTLRSANVPQFLETGKLGVMRLSLTKGKKARYTKKRGSDKVIGPSPTIGSFR